MGNGTALPRTAAIARLMRKTKASGTCLLWQGATVRGGYGRIRDDQSRLAMTHRIAWQAEHGAVPQGMEVDHKCHQRACVNIDHLQLVSRKQNVENRSAKVLARSGYRGVTKRHDEKNWRAQVVHNGEKHSLYGFETALEAHQAAVRLRNKLFTNNLLDRA